MPGPCRRGDRAQALGQFPNSKEARMGWFDRKSDPMEVLLTGGEEPDDEHQRLGVLVKSNGTKTGPAKGAKK